MPQLYTARAVAHSGAAHEDAVVDRLASAVAPSGVSPEAETVAGYADRLARSFNKMISKKANELPPQDAKFETLQDIEAVFKKLITNVKSGDATALSQLQAIDNEVRTNAPDPTEDSIRKLVSLLYKIIRTDPPTESLVPAHGSEPYNPLKLKSKKQKHRAK